MNYPNFCDSKLGFPISEEASLTTTYVLAEVLFNKRNFFMSTFTIQDPEIDFEVIDGGDLGTFDGLGDEVFDTFNTVVRGTFGEAGEFAEFDITGFSISPSEDITNATFQVQLTSLQVGGLGVDFGENPQFLGLYGYVGNGIAEASDFQAGTLLTTLDISQASVGDILTFDVTDFVEDLASDSAAFVGLGVRAQDFGGLAIQESSTVGVPRLTITTTADTPTSLNKTLFGTSAAEILDGGAGNDTLYGNGGNDTLIGGSGDDLIYGGSQADVILAGEGNDTIFANGGGDFINSGAGLDTVWLGAGSATVVLETGSGYDTIKNFQLGQTKFDVVSSPASLSFANTPSGAEIRLNGDLLAVISDVQASTLTDNLSSIFN